MWWRSPASGSSPCSPPAISRSPRRWAISSTKASSAPRDAPFPQIGEHKYGKPILDRVVRSDMALEDGVKVVLISMDSTLRSNLGVGLPVDLLVYRRDSLQVELRRRLTEEDSYFRLV